MKTTAINCFILLILVLLVGVSSKKKSVCEKRCPHLCSTRQCFKSCRAVCQQINTINVYTLQDELTCYDAAQVQCFGAVGPRCNGVHLVAPRRQLNSTRFVLNMSVGSILHDNCCVRARAAGVHGQACKMDASALSIYNSEPCSIEWRKAVIDSYHGYMWEREFNEYSENEFDPVGCDTPARKTFVHNFFSSQYVEWNGKETDLSRTFCAPSGTKLDERDFEFCCSSKFKSVSEQQGSGYCA